MSRDLTTDDPVLEETTIAGFPASNPWLCTQPFSGAPTDAQVRPSADHRGCGLVPV